MKSFNIHILVVVLTYYFAHCNATKDPEITMQNYPGFVHPFAHSIRLRDYSGKVLPLLVTIFEHWTPGPDDDGDEDHGPYDIVLLNVTSGEMLSRVRIDTQYVPITHNYWLTYDGVGDINQGLLGTLYYIGTDEDGVPYELYVYSVPIYLEKTSQGRVSLGSFSAVSYFASGDGAQGMVANGGYLYVAYWFDGTTKGPKEVYRYSIDALFNHEVMKCNWHQGGGVYATMRVTPDLRHVVVLGENGACVFDAENFGAQPRELKWDPFVFGDVSGGAFTSLANLLTPSSHRTRPENNTGEWLVNLDIKEGPGVQWRMPEARYPFSLLVCGDWIFTMSAYTKVNEYDMFLFWARLDEQPKERGDFVVRGFLDLTKVNSTFTTFHLSHCDDTYLALTADANFNIPSATFFRLNIDDL